MKAIVINQPGAPDVLTYSDVSKPEPKENEVVVKLDTTGVNHLDIWVRKGNPAYPVSFPHILGCDGAGIVDSLGKDAEGVSQGERVLVFPGISCGACIACKRGQDNQCENYAFIGAKNAGTYAQYVAVPDQNVVAIPDSLSFEHAAAFPLAYLTAWHMLIGKAKLAAGETVVIVGAGSGVGIAAIQIAKWRGAKILAVTSSKQKANKIKTAGANDVFIEEKDSDFSKWALRNTDGRGADVVVEHVGPVTWEKSVKALSRYGRLVTCGATTGPTVSLDLRYVFSRDLSIFGARMGTQREFQDLCVPIFKGEIVPLIDKIFHLEDAISAHNYMEGKQQVGKILLKVS